MYPMKNIIAIIPARGGSKGIPRKNLKLLNGKPLVWYSIQAALNSKLISRTFVSSDDDEILEFSKLSGADCIKRPDEIAQDTSGVEDSLLHAVETVEKQGVKVDFVVLLQPTSPHRTAEDIDGAIQTLLKNEADSLLSVVPSHAFIWKKEKNNARPINYNFENRPRRQDKEPEFRENGSIYVTKISILKKYKNRLGGKIALFVMDEDKGIDLDSLFDFDCLEFIISRKNQ